MLSDNDIAQADAEYAALPGTQPNCFSHTKISETPDTQAWLREQADWWRRNEGMTHFRATADGDILWLEGWKTMPRKEAPFVGHYTYASSAGEKHE